MLLAEPDLRGHKQEKHAKTMETAQKEVLACIGIALHERLAGVLFRLKEGAQACDVLLLCSLLALRESLEVAIEDKRGLEDVDRVCREFMEEDELKKVRLKKEMKVFTFVCNSFFLF